MYNKLLYYNKPAKHYMEALPLGNGSLGAMCYSSVGTDVISLNHDTLWTGHPRTIKKDGAYESYLKARKLALSGKYVKAQKEIEANFLTCWSQAYMPFGDLKFYFESENFDSYERTLDLSEAVLTNTYKSDGISFRKTAFVSHPNDVMAYRIESENSKTFSFKAELTCPLKNETYTSDGYLIVDGECPGDADTQHSSYPCHSLIYSDKDKERGVLFRGALKVDTDGEITEDKASFTIKNATYVTIYFTIKTSFNGFDKYPAVEGREYKNLCVETLDKASRVGFEAIRERHIADYKSYYDRVVFSLGASDGELIPTDERIKAFQQNKNDDDLYVLLFNFGRYLLISSSREGTQATNLQGIWSNSVKPSWNCNYTTNINTQMNYWPVLPCNMPELMTPLTDLIKTLSVTGEDVAKNFYNANGFVVHHNSDIWGFSYPVQGRACWAFWQGGSGWLCRSLFEIYEYTLDRDFLRNTAYPIMKKAAEFYLDILTEDENGNLIICPGTSPENNFKMGFGSSATSKSTAMMNGIVLDLFTSIKRSCEILSIKDDFYTKICDSIGKIKPLCIGKNGELLEWNEQLPEKEVHHRHVSHLYALHPANLITYEKDRELFEACKKTLEIRGDDGTGWSLAWKINFWARLSDGNHALTLVDKLLTLVDTDGENYHHGGVYPNLFDAHPPFQIDGNFGALSGICEMLLQSDGENIYLLPALPDKWKNGSIKGLAAKGNVTVDIEWKDGKVTDYTLHSDNENIISSMNVIVKS